MEYVLLSIYFREGLISIDRVKCIALKCLGILDHYCSITQYLIRKKNRLVMEIMINFGGGGSERMNWMLSVTKVTRPDLFSV